MKVPRPNPPGNSLYNNFISYKSRSEHIEEYYFVGGGGRVGETILLNLNTVSEQEALFLFPLVPVSDPVHILHYKAVYLVFI